MTIKRHVPDENLRKISVSFWVGFPLDVSAPPSRSSDVFLVGYNKIPEVCVASGKILSRKTLTLTLEGVEVYSVFQDSRLKSWLDRVKKCVDQMRGKGGTVSIKVVLYKGVFLMEVIWRNDRDGQLVYIYPIWGTYPTLLNFSRGDFFSMRKSILPAGHSRLPTWCVKTFQDAFCPDFGGVFRAHAGPRPLATLWPLGRGKSRFRYFEGLFSQQRRLEMIVGHNWRLRTCKITWIFVASECLGITQMMMMMLLGHDGPLQKNIWSFTSTHLTTYYV